MISRKLLTGKYKTSYVQTVAGKIQQYGFDRSIQVDDNHHCFFCQWFSFVRYFALFGRDSQGVFGLAAYLYAVDQPDCLALFAFDRAEGAFITLTGAIL